MKPQVRYREHVTDIERIKSGEKTRLDKIRLDKNERISPFPDEFWREVLGSMTQELVQACPETWPLYQKLSSFLSLEMGQLLLTSGSEMAIRSCIEGFVPPGGKVIYPEPTFAMVPVYCDLYRADRCPVGYDENLDLKTDYLMDCIDPDTRLVILANPNSPTGTYVPNNIIEIILDKTLELMIPLLIDEAYYGFCRHTAYDLLGRYPNLIITRSFSKVTGMAGLRVGYAMGQADLISVLEKFRPMYEVNSVGILFAMKALDNWHIAEAYGKETIEGREFLIGFLKGCGFPVVDTETNFIHVDFGSKKEEILNRFDAKGILVRGMLNIEGYENFTRISVGPKVNIELVMEIIDKTIKERRYKL